MAPIPIARHTKKILRFGRRHNIASRAILNQNSYGTSRAILNQKSYGSCKNKVVRQFQEQGTTPRPLGSMKIHIPRLATLLDGKALCIRLISAHYYGVTLCTWLKYKARRHAPFNHSSSIPFWIRLSLRSTYLYISNPTRKMKLAIFLLSTLCYLQCDAATAANDLCSGPSGPELLNYPRRQQLHTPPPTLNDGADPLRAIPPIALFGNANVQARLYRVRNDLIGAGPLFSTRLLITNNSGTAVNFRVVRVVNGNAQCLGSARWSVGSQQWTIDNNGGSQVFVDTLRAEKPQGVTVAGAKAVFVYVFDASIEPQTRSFDGTLLASLLAYKFTTQRKEDTFQRSGRCNRMTAPDCCFHPQRMVRPPETSLPGSAQRTQPPPCRTLPRNVLSVNQKGFIDTCPFCICLLDPLVSAANLPPFIYLYAAVDVFAHPPTPLKKGYKEALVPNILDRMLLLPRKRIEHLSVQYLTSEGSTDVSLLKNFSSDPRVDNLCTDYKCLVSRQEPRRRSTMIAALLKARHLCIIGCSLHCSPKHTVPLLPHHHAAQAINHSELYLLSVHTTSPLHDKTLTVSLGVCSPASQAPQSLCLMTTCRPSLNHMALMMYGIAQSAQTRPRMVDGKYETWLTQETCTANGFNYHEEGHCWNNDQQYMNFDQFNKDCQVHAHNGWTEPVWHLIGGWRNEVVKRDSGVVPSRLDALFQPLRSQQTACFRCFKLMSQSAIFATYSKANLLWMHVILLFSANKSAETQGPIIVFNVQRENGALVEASDVVNRAQKSLIHLGSVNLPWPIKGEWENGLATVPTSYAHCTETLITCLQVCIDAGKGEWELCRLLRFLKVAYLSSDRRVSDTYLYACAGDETTSRPEPLTSMSLRAKAFRELGWWDDAAELETKAIAIRSQFLILLGTRLSRTYYVKQVYGSCYVDIRIVFYQTRRSFANDTEQRSLVNHVDPGCSSGISVAPGV
ncbi:uncharacterized protein MYCFIDRAFT_173885 [Pseudocercospora fijiensis CIRAD86]|uniref:Uncharacterized protein n=1 Tax=Pseudocercospora fijiensis (strain CIRAD86) TaxID=383855 RepID=M3A1G5_PSEFD|nr:uncharacterized protein MYCFIDRAFT_173885 [Pseudocercospora fijiensis CIRAD86]EME85014.1 hypothetical protein MYCFIDRAFT_173885 [Pseudocercospora fijiensis CIRAD86]